MSSYRHNHYVPIWFQNRFLLDGLPEKKFFYLDLKPQVVNKGKVKYTRKNLMRWGPTRCFRKKDLYTTFFGSSFSTEIEQKFFGRIDLLAPKAVDFFANFSHPLIDETSFHNLVSFMSIQKLRTIKGLAFLADQVGVYNQNELLFKMQKLQQIFCAFWTECVWLIADAKNSETKFILSDHPVTVYNKECLPGSKWCLRYRDPDIRQIGTHTIFPLSLDKVLILTNLSWVRNPYGRARAFRPNSNPFRGSIFNFLGIQTHRFLSDIEVNQINYVIKKRAYKYIAASKEEWLYPERKIAEVNWRSFGDSYFFMPDPRVMAMSSEVIIGYENGRSDAFDEYGRKPHQPGYNDEKLRVEETKTFHRFQGEYARRFGPRRRGRSGEFNKLSVEEDTPDYHKYLLGLEKI